MPQIFVPWGDQTLPLDLPAHWTIEQVAQSSLRPCAEDWADRMALALSQPETGLGLDKLLAARRNGRVVIVVEDMTRHSPLAQILPIVLREIEHAKFPADHVEFVFAAGMHPPLTPQQENEKLGPAAGAYARRSNPWHDRKAYVRIGKIGQMEINLDRGVADADLRIVVSSVSPHLQAGFGGGYKMLVPGCVTRPTIRALHTLGVGRSFGPLAGMDAERNTMRQAIDAAGEMIDRRCGTTFALQYILDDRDMPASVAAGEPIPTQRMLAKQCAVSCGVLINQPADVLITSAHPRDFDLWQSFKCIPNTLWAARPNGVIICLARCPAGVNGMEFPSVKFSSTWARRLLHWIGPDTLPSLLIRTVPKLAGDAAFFVRLAAQALHRNPILMVSPVLHEQGIRFPGLEVLPSVQAAVEAAGKILGTGPQKVVVFPSGGTTYPVPPADKRRT